MIIQFSGSIWYWRGPAPFYFVTIPEQHSENLKAICSEVTYGWGMILVDARINDTQWKTSVFPKDGRYIVPLKNSVRSAESLEEGDTLTAVVRVPQEDAEGNDTDDSVVGGPLPSDAYSVLWVNSTWPT